MINVQHLRVGNFVLADLGLPSIVMHIISPQDIADIANSVVENKGIDVRPMPLTTEMLLKFGFEWESEKQNHLQILFNEDDSVLTFYCENGKPMELQLYSKDSTDYYSMQVPDDVHQLQNLFFALTGYELSYDKNK